MEPDQERLLLNFCKLLIDENRLRILGLLATEMLSVSAIAIRLDLKETVIVRHLAKLREAGFVRREVQAAEERYQLDLDFILATKKELFAPEESTTATEEDDTDKVLNRFIEGDRLRHLPAKHTYRLIILEWVAAKFEAGSQYAEREVNDTLKRYFDDHASLRRALVDYGFMQREKGIYWRVID